MPNNCQVYGCDHSGYRWVRHAGSSATELVCVRCYNQLAAHPTRLT
jgi:hypothetical protein